MIVGTKDILNIEELIATYNKTIVRDKMYMFHRY